MRFILIESVFNRFLHIKSIFGFYFRASAICCMLSITSFNYLSGFERNNLIANYQTEKKNNFGGLSR